MGWAIKGLGGVEFRVQGVVAVVVQDPLEEDVLVGSGHAVLKWQAAMPGNLSARRCEHISPGTFKSGGPVPFARNLKP